MVRHAVMIGLCAAWATVAQVLSFESPRPWATLRSKTLSLRAQIDTAMVAGKQASITVNICSDGTKRRVKSKRFSITKPSETFDMGTVDRAAVGGTAYLSVDWRIPGTDYEGILEPLGIVVLDSPEIRKVISAVNIPAQTDLKTLGKTVADSAGIALGDYPLRYAWNDEGFYIVFQNGDAGVVTCSFDGKNGKNAFSAFADRTVEFNVSRKMVTFHFFRRLVKDNAVTYNKDRWHTNATIERTETHTIVFIPWHDMGFLPFSGRIMGFSAFMLDTDESVSAGWPEDAARFMPGSWGNLRLVE